MVIIYKKHCFYKNLKYSDRIPYNELRQLLNKYVIICRDRKITNKKQLSFHQDLCNEFCEEYYHLTNIKIDNTNYHNISRVLDSERRRLNSEKNKNSMSRNKIISMLNNYITRVDFNEITGHDARFFATVDELLMDMLNDCKYNYKKCMNMINEIKNIMKINISNK